MSIELVKNALRSETFHGTPPVLLKDKADGKLRMRGITFLKITVII